MVIHEAKGLTNIIDLNSASPSEFVIPFSKYNKAMYTQGSLGMRFRMMFTTEESGVRRYMGTITGISDLDPVRWKNSQWRNLQVSLAACTFHMIWWLCKLSFIVRSCVTIGPVVLCVLV
jgi:hypothetical protein